MASPYLLQAIDGTDIGYNKSVTDTHVAVALSGDRRSFSATNPTGNFTYDGVVRSAFVRTYLNTDTFPDRTAMTVRNVTNDATFVAALTAAGASGTPSIIVVALGTYTGTYTAPSRVGDLTPGGNNIVVIISKAIYDSMPGGASWVSTVCPPKVQVTAADLPNMPYFKNISVANAEQWAFNRGTSGWRFIGIRFGADTTVTQLSRLLRFGNGDTNVQQVSADCPENLGLDRCAWDGHATLNLKAGVEFHAKSQYAIDCYTGDNIHHNGQDCQAIRWYNSPGPTRIVNCRLVASTENVLVGGNLSACGLPSDLEFRWNTLEKPLTWNASHPTYAGVAWSIKNLFEAKALGYALIEGNYIRRSWPSGQAGAALLIKAESYGNGATIGYTHDILVRYNRVEDMAMAINIAGVPNVDAAHAPVNVCSYGNLYQQGAQYFSSAANPYIGSGLLSNCGSIHDTFIPKGSVLAISQPTSSAGFYLLDTILGADVYGIKGAGLAEGTATLAAECVGYDVRHSVFTGRAAGSYPATNYFPANLAAIQFTNTAGDDYSLLGTSQTGSNPPVVTSLAVTTQPVGAATGSPLSVQPVVRFNDQFGSLFSTTATVTAAVASGNATITAGSTAVAVAGVATFAGLTLTAPSTGPVTLTFSATGVASATSSSFTITVSVTLVPSALAVTSQPTSGTSGAVLAPAFVIGVVDQNGAPISSTATVSAAIGSGGGTLSGGTTSAAIAGTATFSTAVVTSSSTVAPVFTFTAPGLTPVSSAAVSVAAIAPVGVVAQLVVTRQPSGISTGRVFSVQPIVEAQDVNGRRVTSYTGYVTCAVASGPSQLKGTTRVQCVAGVATFTNLRLVGAGTDTLQFEAS